MGIQVDLHQYVATVYLLVLLVLLQLNVLHVLMVTPYCTEHRLARVVVCRASMMTGQANAKNVQFTVLTVLFQLRTVYHALL
jgi:hypothetical protein